MTNQEINRRVAEIEGLKVWVQASGPHKGTVNADGPLDSIRTIDYINDWNLLGPLMLKLLKSTNLCIPMYNHIDDSWGIITNIASKGYHKEFGKALCLAYIKEFGGE